MDDRSDGKHRGILLVGAGLATCPMRAQQAAPLPQLFLTPDPLSKDGERAHRAVGGRRRGPCRCEMRPTGILRRFCGRDRSHTGIGPEDAGPTDAGKPFRKISRRVTKPFVSTQQIGYKKKFKMVLSRFKALRLP